MSYVLCIKPYIYIYIHIYIVFGMSIADSLVLKPQCMYGFLVRNNVETQPDKVSE